MKPQHSSSDVPFGDRYLLCEQLAIGGMAEVHRARQLSPSGFEKEVVVKRLKPQLAADPRIVEMFTDEARVSALLSHPNAVHVFDAGIEDGLPYIAMEYIDGVELNVLCRRGLAAGNFLPVQHAVELVRQAALAMGYFHNLQDASGEPLNLVHCDISPNNLLITADGFLKVIDFGIAQFLGQSYSDADLVPGKLSYMSPEQARRDRLDRRSDIFSLAIVLYEVTLGQRLFRGPAHDVKARLLAGDIQPPTFVRRDFPADLETVIMRALEPEPSDRFQEAFDFADALAAYLHDGQFRTGPLPIARYLDSLAVASGQSQREELIPEADLASDEEALDFDRGRHLTDDRDSGAEESQAAKEWDDVDEDDAAVADVLGIDVNLVARSSRAKTEPSLRVLARRQGRALPTAAAMRDATGAPRAQASQSDGGSADSSVPAAASASDGGHGPLIVNRGGRVLSAELPVGQAPVAPRRGLPGVALVLVGLILGAGAAALAYYLVF